MTEPAAGRRDGLLATAVLVGIAILVFAPHLFGGRVFCFRDLADYAIPQKLFSVAELRAGRLPLWNPLNFFGFPHLANLQSGVLYPPNLLLLLPFPLGFNLVHVGHYLLAAVGVWWLAVELQVGPAGRLIAAIGYGFSPYLLSLTDLNAFLFTASWLPWMLVSGARLGRGPRPAVVAATAIVFALSLLAGEPQTFLVGCLLAAVLSVGTLRTLHLGRLARLMLAWLIAAIVAALLVAPALLPFVELVQNSERSGAGLSAAEVYKYSLEWGDVGDLLLPGFSGDVVAGTHWRGSQVYVRRPYLGIAILGLALVAVIGTRRSALGRRFTVAVLTCLAGGGALLSLGSRGGLYPLLLALGYSQSRFPVKFLIVTVLALALLAGQGADRLLRGGGRRGLAAVLSLGLLGSVAAMGLAPSPSVSAGATHVLAVCVCLIGALLMCRLAAADPRRRRRAGVLVGFVVVFDLVVAASPVLTTTAAATLQSPPPQLVALAASDRQRSEARVCGPQITAETLAFVYPDGVVDSRSLQLKKSLLFGNLNQFWGIASIRGGESMEIRWVAEVIDEIDRGPRGRSVLDLAGVTAFLHYVDLARFGFVPGAKADGVTLFRNPAAFPPAFLVGATRTEVDGEGTAALAAADLDLRRVALTDRPIADLAGDPCVRGTVDLRREPGGALTLAITSPGRCLLVLTDTWYPGWTALLAGDRTEILRVNHAFRGVVVPSGRSEVRFLYQPRSFGYGLQLFVVGLAALAALALAATRRPTGTPPALGVSSPR